MSDSKSYGEESTAVQAHLSITQSVVQRMAANSASSKAWCITLVSAILVIVADKSKPQYALIAGIPTLLFFALDTYYLALERGFRESYNEFIEKLHDGRVVAADLYVTTPKGPLLTTFVQSLGSFSIWPFYLTMAVMIWLTRRILIA